MRKPRFSRENPGFLCRTCYLKHVCQIDQGSNVVSIVHAWEWALLRCVVIKSNYTMLDCLCSWMQLLQWVGMWEWMMEWRTRNTRANSKPYKWYRIAKKCGKELRKNQERKWNWEDAELFCCILKTIDWPRYVIRWQTGGAKLDEIWSRLACYRFLLQSTNQL